MSFYITIAIAVAAGTGLIALIFGRPLARRFFWGSLTLSSVVMPAIVVSARAWRTDHSIGLVMPMDGGGRILVSVAADLSWTMIVSLAVSLLVLWPFGQDESFRR